MKIATFNINNINRRFGNLADWLREARPDVVCLQELKCEQSRFPAAEISELGYAAVWQGQRAWNGVAILAQRPPVLTRTQLPGDAGDRQARYIEAAVGGVLICSVYAPNGNPRPGPKFDYKLAWMKRLNRHARTLIAAQVPVVLAGDFNVVPTDLDIYRTRSWDKDALLQPEPRTALTSLLQQGWVDTIRHLHPGEPKFSFWHYMRHRWERKAGLRIDLLLASPVCVSRLTGGDVDAHVRGLPDASDHAPVWIDLEDE